jgi:hypothetical protein
LSKCSAGLRINFGNTDKKKGDKNQAVFELHKSTFTGSNGFKQIRRISGKIAKTQCKSWSC